METVGTKPALRATDRLRQTVAALAKLLDQTMIDIQALDSELQEHNQVSKELEQLRQAAEEAVQAEAARVEALIQEINSVIDNPDTELSVVIRKNAERAELESYLKGLRFRIADR